MAFILDKEEIELGLIIFRREDVGHDRWYCRIKLPGGRYKSLSLNTADVDQARIRAHKQEAKAYCRVQHRIPLFNPPFSVVARRYLATQRERAEEGRISAARLRKIEYVITRLLIPYIGTMPIQCAVDERRTYYTKWRRGELEPNGRRKVGYATIAAECGVFNAVLNYGANQGYLAGDLPFTGHPKYLRPYRNGLTKDQYRHLLMIAKRRICAAQGTARWRH